MDANVLVSALFGGLPRKAVLKAFEGDVFLSPQTRDELLSLNQKLSKRLPLDRYLEWNTSFLPLLSQMIVVPVRHPVVLCRDAKDDAYLALAKAAKVDFLVTGDDDLLSVPQDRLEEAGLSGLTIVNPADFLKRPDLPERYEIEESRSEYKVKGGVSLSKARKRLGL